MNRSQDEQETSLEQKARAMADRWESEADALESFRATLEAYATNSATRELLLGAIVKLRKCATEVKDLVIPF